MKPFRGRVSGVAVLVAIVLLLVPLLAWLQYRWLGQVSEAERERMQRTLRTAAAQFARDFDGELSKAMVGLQLEGAVARDQNWTSYASRYTTWAERAQDTRLVRDVLYVDAQPGAKAPPTAEHLRIRRWNNAARVFEPAEWTEELVAMRGVLANHFGEIRMMRSQGNGRFRREGALSFTVGDEHTLLSPVTLFEFSDAHDQPPRIDILGFVLVRLDPAFLRETMLPTLAARHFHGEDAGADEYRIAVTDRDDTTHIIWESSPGAASAIGPTPDVVQPFMSPRPDQLVWIARNGVPAEGRPMPPMPNERIMISVMQDRRGGPDGHDGRSSDRGRGFSPFEGRWRVAATHRTGSLEAAVAAVRSRNLMLSSGILLLLTATIGLIVISARRAQNLARQQMEFVAAVSHELRTPVSVIGAAAGNLADGVVSEPTRVRKYGETIQGEARRLAETVERVLQLAGIAAGRAAADRVPVDVAGLVQQSIDACRQEIDAAGVTMEVRVADDLPLVEGDVVALRSALQNLISNAVKYGGDAKWVRVEARGGNPSGLPNRVFFSISDRGLGISAEDRKHIFEPFYRGREAIARQIQGSGLGLNLVSRIAKAHGGRVTVTSEPGKGSTFTLVLPAVSSRRVADGAQTVSPRPAV